MIANRGRCDALSLSVVGRSMVAVLPADDGK